MDTTGMILIDPEKLYYASAERVVIQADTAPATMPTTGAGVDGLPDSVQLLPGSILYVLATGKTYIMDSTGAWQEWAA